MDGLEADSVEPSRIPALIRESFALVEPYQDKATAHFYALIFLEHPEIRDMFPPMMDTQRDRLMSALVRVVGQVDAPESLAGYLRQLGRDHRKFGARPEHYDVVWRCLITALKRFAGPGWTPEMDAAWLMAYQIVAGTMIEAAEEAARTSPAWWTAKVVHHERRTRDIAVITLEPDQPYPFRPGQYASLETQRWPRVWRHYSMANAPRADGLVRLHVRAVPAGWVSSALVHHTSVGDTVRMGPPVGTMFCNTASARDVLLIAGGTGLAPLKALVEDMANWNTNRRVRLFFGARRANELYDTPDLVRLTERCPWLTVVTPVSHDPRYPGERGMLPDVVTRHGEFHGHWQDHDVYVAGSATMVRATIARLQELDIPLAHIRFDAYGETEELYGVFSREAPIGASSASASVGSSSMSSMSSASPQSLPQGLPRGMHDESPHASKSSSTSDVSGLDWQASTNPSAFSSGSKA
jgi:NAD(P)H-flavin reductase/hemoglobin-like flavoprotein